MSMFSEIAKESYWAYIETVIARYKDDVLGLDMECEREEVFDKMVKEIMEGSLE